ASAAGQFEPAAADAAASRALRQRLIDADYDGLETTFLNHDAVVGMLHFGKDLLHDFDTVPITDIHDLAVYDAYRQGAWDLY
ncbi:MAG: hypothetical protein AAF772_21245, partial [Acidobacteriota bacterium]